MRKINMFGTFLDTLNKDKAGRAAGHQQGEPAVDAVIKTLGQADAPLGFKDLLASANNSAATLLMALRELESASLIERIDSDQYTLTPLGREVAAQMRA